MTEKPHVTLNRAADLLEARAGKATPGPYAVKEIDGLVWVYSTSHGAVTTDMDAGFATQDTIGVAMEWDGEQGRHDARWVAMAADPRLAAPLVALLRVMAQYARALAVLRGPVEEDMHVKHALVFARMVLGEGQ